MRSWPAPEVPRLPGAGPPLQLYDTATGEVRPVLPAAGDSTPRMYVCGITPYDATHLGHASTYIAFDLVNRFWRDSGHDMHYVQNVTDVDDPLLERADQTGEDWRALADREIESFREDMTALRVVPPRDYVGAVESIPLIVELVQRLRDRGAAYDLDGDLYFPVESDPRFGAVSHLDRARMLKLFGERGGDPNRPGKKHPLDSLLWQSRRPGEPAWESTLGAGRPGWHVECAAISLRYLGMGFDALGGGSDLIFPHHEMSAAKAQAATGEWPYARHFVHAGMVGLSGEKMSKSRGNLVFVSPLRARVDPMAIRLALLAHHYRSDWQWTENELSVATQRLAHWRAAVALPHGPPAGTVLETVRDQLADDLDAPSVLGSIDDWAARALQDVGDDPAAPRLIAETVDALLGVDLLS